MGAFDGATFFGVMKMLRLIFRYARRVNERVLSVQLNVPVEITKFLIIGSIVLVVVGGVLASQKVSTDVDVGHSGVRVKSWRPQQEDYASVNPTNSDREPITEEKSRETIVQPSRGYFIKRYRVIGDGEEGQYFYRNAKCPAVSKDPRIEKVCSMAQSERHKYPIDVVDYGSKNKRKHSSLILQTEYPVYFAEA